MLLFILSWYHRPNPGDLNDQKSDETTEKQNIRPNTTGLILFGTTEENVVK